MIDQGELDWKILAIRADDPRSQSQIRDAADIEELFPKAMGGILEWFRWYKTPDGKSLNTFGYDEKWLSVEDTSRILLDGHWQWMSLVNGEERGEGVWIPVHHVELPKCSVQKKGWNTSCS